MAERVTYVNPNPPDGKLDPATRWIAQHSTPGEPWESVAWKRLTLAFTIAVIWGALAASVVTQWLEERRGKR